MRFKHLAPNNCCAVWDTLENQVFNVSSEKDAVRLCDLLNDLESHVGMGTVLERVAAGKLNGDGSPK